MIEEQDLSLFSDELLLAMYQEVRSITELYDGGTNRDRAMKIRFAIYDEFMDPRRHSKVWREYFGS